MLIFTLNFVGVRKKYYLCIRKSNALLSYKE